MKYTTGGRFFSVKKTNGVGKVTRITCKQYSSGLTPSQPKVGDTVIIIIKPYTRYVCEQGVVATVLTKKAIHTRGHKVRLRSGSVGRIVKHVKSH
jgi:uncharacterized repeat protein (TIGR03833 family)